MELDITFGSCIPRVSFRALPSFGLCRGVVATALIMRLDFDAVALRPLDSSDNKKISARTHSRKYVVLVSVSTCTHYRECAYLYQ